MAQVNQASLQKFLTNKVAPFLQNLGKEIERDASNSAPVDTGDLKNSFSTSQPDVSANKVSVTVSSSSDHALPVETGTGPQHEPTPNPIYFPKKTGRLIQWSNKRGLDPFQVARGIAAHGTPANPMLRPAIENALRKYNFRWK